MYIHVKPRFCDISGTLASFYDPALLCQNRLFSVLFSVLQHGSDAEDVIQGAVLKAFINLCRLREKTNLQTLAFSGCR